MAKINWRPFEEARDFVRNLGLKNFEEWCKWASTQRPSDIPSNPNLVYKDEWINFADWLGNQNIKTTDKKFRDFKEARDYVHHLKLGSVKYWKEWINSGEKPNDIPANPPSTYKNKGWISWGDWLGTGTIAPQYQNHRKFDDARTFVHSLGFTGAEQYKSWAKTSDKPDDIPADPYRVYKDDGWESWGDWVGTNFIARQKREYIKFNEARQFVHKLGLKNKNESVFEKLSEAFEENLNHANIEKSLRSFR